MERYIIREPRISDYPQGMQNSNQLVASSGLINESLDDGTVMFLERPLRQNQSFTHNVYMPYTPANNKNNFSNVQMNSPSYVPHCLPQGQGPMVSGIDPRYLAAYADPNVNFIATGKPQESTMILEAPKPFKNETQISVEPVPTAPIKKTEVTDVHKSEIQNVIMSRADKLKALHRSGARVFSGPVEKVLKWHKALQDIGIYVIYEIVAKCVNIRQGEPCAKNLVVRDENGPAMQIVYYEVDFLLPDLTPPCTVRIIGRMMAGSSRFQAFNVRPATGDDVAILPRRAAVAAHHVAKICKEYSI